MLLQVPPRAVPFRLYGDGADVLGCVVANTHFNITVGCLLAPQGARTLRCCRWFLFAELGKGPWIADLCCSAALHLLPSEWICGSVILVYSL